MKKIFMAAFFVGGMLLGVLGRPHAPSNYRPGTLYMGDSLLTIDVFYAPSNQVITLDLEEYVRGVVCGEMPASFHPEALKAQAICARTYAVRKMRIFGGNSFSDAADVSSDPKRDQAWVPDETLRQRWGVLGMWTNMSKIEKAVKETKGLILTYKGNPCEALYHSTCGGKTEAAKDVFSNDLPYLVSIPCSFCSKSPHYNRETVAISRQKVSELLSLAGKAVPAAAIKGADFAKVSDVCPTGRLKEVIVEGEAMKATDFRMALGLKSTMMSWEVSGDDVIFTVQGYGHGVGMCQYGADGMGREGRTFGEILSYYYPGTEVGPLFTE